MSRIFSKTKCAKCKKPMFASMTVGDAHYGKDAPRLCETCYKAWAKYFMDGNMEELNACKTKNCVRIVWTTHFEKWVGLPDIKPIKVVFT